jgi:hypothetical protein
MSVRATCARDQRRRIPGRLDDRLRVLRPGAACTGDVGATMATPGWPALWTSSVQLTSAAACGVYAVVQCSSFDQRCVNDTSFTSGLVADLIGTRVTGVQLDDAEGYQGMIAEASIYPSSVRSTAINAINSDGSASLRTSAAKAAGCPHGS